MKTLTVTLLLLYSQSCLGTFVVDLNQPSNEDRKTFLALDKGIEFNNPLTFCLRFNIKDALATNYIFSSKDDELVFILSFSNNFGIVIINSVDLVFEIPEDNDVLPFRWHHICVSSGEDSYYSIVVDGQQWYRANHTIGSFKKTTIKRLDLGSTNDYWVYSDGLDMRGFLSELNIWSKSLSIIQMVKITRNCKKVDPIPDVLNWSELPKSIIRGSTFIENLENICPQSNSTAPIYKIMPYLHDQDNAIYACKILNGELVFPNSLDELQTWKSKLGRMKCKINVSNNFPLITLIFSVVTVSEYPCHSFTAPIRKSSNGSWINQIDNRIVDMEHLWNSRSPYGGNLFDCTGFHANDCKYYATTCKSKRCFICAWKNSPLFTLRGLCANTQVDEQFVLLPEKTFGGNVFFFGVGKGNILFNQETSSWIIVKNKAEEIFKPGGISADSLDVIGTYQHDWSHDIHLPVGAHFWNLTENCNKVLQLKLTQVTNEITFSE